MEGTDEALLPEQSDAAQLAAMGQPTLGETLQFAQDALGRVKARFAALDLKASQISGLIGVLGALLAFALPPRGLKDSALGLLAAAAAFLIGSAACSVVCLRIRSVREPPTVHRIVRWLSKHRGADLDLRLLSSLVVDLANAEESHLTACNAKARALSIGQVLYVIGLALLLGYAVARSLFFEQG